ncbi:Ivy family c-type lysozyme inhibitor [Rhizobium sp. FY34]|uniref:Ivy family c-type lysozyme inhibitor n=1 Tax=Rhizobium sp. FY34 TaxID=2562309 RepID=UPI0010C1235A|nr:Ivy family c-type lysozyme inhibitor [Rhizobium sp. FY34]
MQIKSLIVTVVALMLCLGLASTVTAEEAKSGRFLHEVIASSPAHQTSLRDMLRSARSLPPWARNMVTTPRYVSGASRAVTVDGQPMELFGACVAKQCEESRLRVLFTPQGKTVALRIVDLKLGVVVVGQPSEAALIELASPGL